MSYNISTRETLTRLGHSAQLTSKEFPPHQKNVSRAFFQPCLVSPACLFPSSGRISCLSWGRVQSLTNRVTLAWKRGINTFLGRESFGQKLFQGGKKKCIFRGKKQHQSDLESSSLSISESTSLVCSWDPFGLDPSVSWSKLCDSNVYVIDHDYVTAISLLLVMIWWQQLVYYWSWFMWHQWVCWLLPADKCFSPKTSSCLGVQETSTSWTLVDN